ncbi:MAG TPA: DNRLRE domain-containing protein [Candidatus Sulfotelmatobacter sp.]|nr:DNRLRE domain-containing protein [Candidatus Sulfotelmatobacter sp.]
MDRQNPVVGIGRVYWRRWFSLGLALMLAAPLIARETIVLQKSATDPQARGADATLNQATPTTNNVGNTLTVSGVNDANDRAIIEFDLSRIPNAGIKAATLTLHVITPPSGTVNYDAFNVTNFWQSNAVTWNTRVATTAWAAAGGDIAATATDTETVRHNSTSVSFDITADVQNWYNGTPNYGMIITDENTNHDRTTVFGSKQATTSTNAPELDVTFVQNVKGLTAAPGNASITLNWQIPALIGTPVGTESYTGVVILRRASSPVDKGSVPTDGMSPALCSTVGTGTVVFNDTSGKTTFTDNSSDTCGAPANGTTYFYKVFLRDSSNFYSSQPITNGSTFTEEISATPAATIAAQQNTQWIAATFATDLASPALIPGNVAVVGSGIDLLFMINAATGLRQFPPVSLGGAVASRSPAIDAASSSTGQDIVYVTDQDGLVYGIFTDTGVIDWVVNPTTGANLELQGGPAVQLKSITGGLNDQVFFGTRNTGTTTGNQIFALNGNTGANASWSPITGSTGSVPKLDIINSTPLVDYLHSAIWVTSRSACGTGQPSLWKINPSTGAILAMEDLGDIDASPTLSAASDLLVVANNGDAIVGGTCTAGNSTIYAINPTTGATLISLATTDGPIVSYPVVLGSAPHYTVIYSGSTAVHLLGLDTSRTTPVFGPVWTTAITNPSAPISVTGLSFIFVGSSDGTIHELALATGADVKDEVTNTGPTIGTVGDPSIDEALSRIYVTTTDQRAYAFTIPF